MEPIQLLEEEHRAIERALDALDRYVVACEQWSAPPPRADLLQFVEIFQHLADEIHHGKEEDILFDQMIRAGFPRQQGPLAVMVHEHDKGRAFVRQLKSLGEMTEPWSDAEKQRFKSAATGFTNLLRQHIFKEDNILYPMACARLDAEVMNEITAKFAAHELSQEQSGEKKRLLALVDGLAQRYGE